MPLISNPLPHLAPPSRSRWRRFVLRAARARFALGLGVAAIILLGVGAQVSDIVLYNHSPSMPVGFYVRANDRVGRGAIVTVRAADVAGDAARARGFDDPGDRFIKRVAATAGEVVCGDDGSVTLNGAVIAHRVRRDSTGRALPTWNGCRRLAEDESAFAWPERR